MKPIINYLVICSAFVLLSAESLDANPYLKTKGTIYSWINNSWTITQYSNMTIDYSFDTADRVAEFIDKYNGISNFKRNLTYYSDGKLQFSADSVWQPNVWLPYEDFQNFYNNGNLSVKLTSTYNPNDGTKSKDSTVYYYQNNIRIADSSWILSSNTWKLSNYTSFVQDANGRDSNCTAFFYDSTKTVQLPFSRIVYVYDNNSLLVTEYNQYPNMTSDTSWTWGMGTRNLFKYNGKNQLVEKTTERFNNGKWTSTGTKYQYSYNSRDSLAEEVDQVWQDSIYANYVRYVYEYSEISDVPVEESSSFQSILSPNPVSEILNIQIPSGSFGSAQVKIYSQNGEEVLARNVEIENGSSSFRLDNLGSLTSGVYLVSVNINGTFFRQKFVKM